MMLFGLGLGLGLGLYRIGIIRLKEEEDATSDIAKHEKHHDIEQQ